MNGKKRSGEFITRTHDPHARQSLTSLTVPSQKVTAIDSVHPLAAAVENLFGTQTKRWFCVTVHGHAVVKEPQMDADQRRWSARAFRRLHTILSGDRFGIYDHCLETDPVDAFQLSEEILVPSFPDSCF